MKNYNFHPVLLVRIPAMAYNHFKKDDPAFYLDKIYFRNSLLLAAPAFYEALLKAGFKIAALKPKALKTLDHYLNRIHYRSTPFGLFSGISAIQWQSENEAERLMLLGERKLHLWPDLEQVNNTSIEAVLFSGDLLFFNPSTYRVGDTFRFIKKELSESRKNFLYGVSVIPYHSLTDRLLSCFQVPTSISAAFKRLQLQDPSVSETDFLNFVNHLCREQLLLSRSGFKVLDPLPFKTRILDTKMLDDQPIDTGGEHYYANLAFKLKGGIAPRKYQQPILDGLYCLSHLCPELTPDGLRKFKSDFNHKFEDRVIPLMVALDPELGVGYRRLEHAFQQASLLEEVALPGIGTPNHKDLQWTKVHALLLDKIQQTHDLKQGGIQLNSGDFDGWQSTSSPVPPGLSVLFRPLGDQVFIESAGGATATALLGRFGVFDDSIHQTLQQIADNEVVHNAGVVFAEINCVQELHTANVEQRKSYYPYEIPVIEYPSLESENIIALSDLWITVKRGHIILWSQRLQKEVIPRLSSAYNHARSQLSVYRFLCDLQYQNIRTHFSFDLSHFFPFMDFYPRVTYNNSILSPATWILSLDTLKEITGQQTRNSTKVFHNYLDEKGVPKLCAISSGDLQLVYDRNDRGDQQRMFELLEKLNTLQVKEFPFPTSTAVVKDESGGVYLPQYLTTLLHTEKIYGFPTDFVADHIALFNEPRQDTDWVYLKVYCHPGNCFEILDGLREFLKLEEAVVKKFFYVLYADPGYHVRLRLECHHKEDKGRLLLRLEEVLHPMYQRGLISQIQMDHYKKELERYGKGNIALVETIFSADTFWVTQIRHPLSLLPVPEYMDVLVSVDLLLEAFGMDTNAKIAHCQMLTQSLFAEFGGGKPLQVSLNEKYRSVKKTLEDYWEQRRQVLVLQEGYLKTTEAIVTLAIVNKGTGERPSQTLCADIIHMHLNRLFAEYPREQEMVIYSILSQYLKGVGYRQVGV